MAVRVPSGDVPWTRCLHVTLAQEVTCPADLPLSLC